MAAVSNEGGRGEKGRKSEIGVRQLGTAALPEGNFLRFCRGLG
jgi:hypothetical protein